MIPKFRGKSTAEENKGEWVYGNLVFDKDLAIIVSGIDEATCEYIAFEDFCSVDIDTVGQSAGLFDKNGVEIFEGDVLAVETDEEVTNVNVFWDKKHALFMFKSKKYNEEELLAELVEDNTYPFEIIGNIWDGGDLIDN